MTSVHLSEVITFKKGKKPKRLLEQAQDGALPYILIESFEGKPSAFTDDASCPVVIPSDTLLVCDGARTGLSCSRLHGYIGSTLATLKPDEAKIEPAYLSYFVGSKYDLLNSRTRGAAIPHLDRDLLMGLEIPLPPLAEQRRIVDILSRAEGIVRLRRDAENKAAELIPALFLDMFGDPATNLKGWEQTTLGSVADVQGGLQVTTARDIYPLVRPYLRVANVHRSRLDLTEIKSIRLTPAEFTRTKLAVGDLLVVEGHGNPNEIGRVAIWDGSIADCVHQNHIIRARCSSVMLRSGYACEYLNSASGRQFLLRSGKTTSGLNTISVSNVKDATILLPPTSLQEEFESIIESISSIKSQQSAATAKAQATFDALLAQVFTK